MGGACPASGGGGGPDPCTANRLPPWAGPWPRIPLGGAWDPPAPGALSWGWAGPRRTRGRPINLLWRLDSIEALLDARRPGPGRLLGSAVAVVWACPSLGGQGPGASSYLSGFQQQRPQPGTREQAQELPQVGDPSRACHSARERIPGPEVKPAVERVRGHRILRSGRDSRPGCTETGLHSGPLCASVSSPVKQGVLALEGAEQRPPARPLVTLSPRAPRPPPLANPQGLHLALDRPRGPAGSRQPRLLGRIPTPIGAAGGPRGLHCSPDGLLFLTVGASPYVHVLDLEGHSVCRLPCCTPGAGAFVPEDVAVTAAGLVVVSDLTHGAVHALQHATWAPQGRWVTVGTFLSPQGLAVDALGRFLVTDYVPGAVHCFSLGPAFETLAPTVTWGLQGPCWVGPGPDGGLAVSEECGEVRLFGSTLQSLGSLGDLTGHPFGSPGGVCSDTEGNIIVADKQRCQVTLFRRAGPPVCLVSEGLGRPSGVAWTPQGQLVVADAGHGCLTVHQCCTEMA